MNIARKPFASYKKHNKNILYPAFCELLPCYGDRSMKGKDKKPFVHHGRAFQVASPSARRESVQRQTYPSREGEREGGCGCCAIACDSTDDALQPLKVRGRNGTAGGGKDSESDSAFRTTSSRCSSHSTSHHGGLRCLWRYTSESIRGTLEDVSLPRYFVSQLQIGL